jgi:hypothetical protein
MSLKVVERGVAPNQSMAGIGVGVQGWLSRCIKRVHSAVVTRGELSKG